MTNWLTVFLYELRLQFRRKAYLFVTFGVPLLAIAAFFGYQAIKEASGGDSTNEDLAKEITNPDSITDMAIGYVDETREELFPPPDSYEGDPADCEPANSSEASLLLASDLTDAQRADRARLIKRLTSPYCLRDIIHAYPSRQAGLDALDKGTLDVLYVIEPDYATTGNISLYISGFSIEGASTDALMEGYVLSSLLYNVDPTVYERVYLRLRDAAVINEHLIGEDGAAAAQNEDQNFVLVYAFGLIMMLSLMWGGGYVMQSVVQEKESRIIEIILSSVRPLPLLTGKVLAMGLLSALQIATLIGAFIFIAGQAGDVVAEVGDIEVRPLLLALMPVYFVLGFLFYGSLMAAIGAISSSVRESQNFVVVVTLPAAIPFFFLAFFVEEPNSTLARILSLFPVTSPLSMVMRLSVVDVAAGELILSVALLVGGVVAAIGLAGRLFRVNTLLMGNTPKLKDLPKLIRG